MKTKRTRPTKSSGITTSLKKRMNFRDRLKNKAIKTKDASIWNQFRKVKNQVKQEIKSAKKAYYNYAFNTLFSLNFASTKHIMYRDFFKIAKVNTREI